MNESHDWALVLSTSSSPGGSVDRVEQCRKCCLIRHDYEYGTGQRSPNYPRFISYGSAVVDDGCSASK